MKKLYINPSDVAILMTNLMQSYAYFGEVGHEEKRFGLDKALKGTTDQFKTTKKLVKLLTKALDRHEDYTESIALSVPKPLVDELLSTLIEIQLDLSVGNLTHMIYALTEED